MVLALLATFIIGLVQFTGAQEFHEVSFVNNCGFGNGVFTFFEHDVPQGSATVQGMILGGIAWLNGTGNDCQADGVNCGVVEFALRSDIPNMNEAFFDISGDPADGSHQFTGPMSFHFDGVCTQGAVCASPENCPDEVVPGLPVPLQCPGANVGITITFC
ncbi:hypothetical protein BC629DRAFT_729810 [Irpex lacteus]|nr:hypothetical protein BC629DRAFT_729810 [Irpex lacteus]